MYESILLPVDGNDDTADVVHHTAEVAQSTGARVELLFVADTTQDSVTAVDGAVVDVLKREGETVVADVAKTLDTLGVDHGTDVVQGAPAPTIADYAQQYDYDLIVLPTHGRTGVSRYLLGSVTERVVRLSDIPVLTARMDPDEQLTFPYEHVLVPTDGSPAATAAADHGLALAAALNATVHVLAGVNDTLLTPNARAVISEEALERPAVEAVEAVTTRADEHGLTDVRTAVEHGPPAELIREYVVDNEIDAIVMGASGRRGVDRILLGSVAAKTLRSASVPVVTVHDRS